MVRKRGTAMATTLQLSLRAAAVKPRVSLGRVAGTIATDDWESGNALILVVTNPRGPNVELTSCIGERLTGWRGRHRERFSIPMNGFPHRFGEDGDSCMAWAEIRYLPELEGLAHLYVRDSNGDEHPVENPEMVLQIRDHLLQR
jgi:hypothetical protein